MRGLLLLLACLSLAVPAEARRHRPCGTTSTTTTTTTTTTLPGGCASTYRVRLICSDEAGYDFFQEEMPPPVICAGQRVACDARLDNTSPCDADVVWAGLKIDRLVDGQQTDTTGQTFNTDYILHVDYSLYELPEGGTFVVCLTDTGECAGGQPSFDPVMGAELVGHDVQLRAAFIIRTESDDIVHDDVVTVPVSVVPACP